MTKNRPYDAVKRAGDLLVAAVLLIVTLPIQLVVAGLVLARLGRPVLFKQARPGRDGQVFNILKYRTMKNPDHALGVLADEDRLTPFGRRLRSTSLDELPALVNVLVGDMSLVGPRPLLVEYLELYSPAQARRHEVRPGVTGLAQVSGRNALTWEDRFALDIEYVENRSLWLDLRILVSTVSTVLKREGVSAQGSATMTPFKGSNTAGIGHE